MPQPADVEFLIVGQGLAGTAVAWHLWWAGADFVIMDREEPSTSSRIAAGLITPITGQRLALGWRIDEMLDAARAFYRRIEQETGASLFHEREILRRFRGPEEVERWSRKKDDPAFRRFVAGELAPGEPLGAHRAGPHGGIVISEGGQLDCAAHLEAARAFFTSRGRYLRGDHVGEDASPRARRIILCQGHAAVSHPHFRWVPWKAAKGEILTLQVPGLCGDPRILSAGQWLAPGAAGAFRTGSTYDWERLDAVPTPAGRLQLEQGLAHVGLRGWTITGHQAAVRPIIRESRALAGAHPARPQLVFFNGLGSKGALHAPLIAGDLVAHLTRGTPLDPAWDLQSNLAG